MGFAQGPDAYTFAYPTTGDFPAAGGAVNGAITRNTGTDAIMYRGQTLQAMTWDNGNGQAYLSWAQGNGGPSGSIPLPGNYVKDPDVVMAANGGTIWANVVYVDASSATASGQTQRAGYRWDGTNFNRVFGPDPLGNNRYDHYNPNIDANSSGLVGIVWQQRTTTSATVTVSSTAFPAYQFTQDITFDRSYLAGSWIYTNQIADCYRYDGYTGIPVLNPATGLMEQTLSPDVALSEGDTKPIVSVSFIRHYVDGRGSFSIVDKLAVKQTLFNTCEEVKYEPQGENPVAVNLPPYTQLQLVDYYEWDPTYGSLGRPRIAARPKDEALGDVEVVLDESTYNCRSDVTSYGVWNYGKSGGAFRPSSLLVSVAPYPLYPTAGNTIPVKEPVVSYYGGGKGDDGLYVINWTATGYNPKEDQEQEDVWSCSFRNGAPETPGSSPLIARAYSRVNGRPGANFGYWEQNQHTSSVAGRYIAYTGSVHLFVDDRQNQVLYKFSSSLAGQQPMRPGTPGTSPATAPKAMQAYPNPAAGAVEVRLNLRSDERVQQLTVVDQLGRLVNQLPLPQEGSAEPLTWKPAAHLPTGSYVLKLVTSQRAESLTIERK